MYVALCIGSEEKELSSVTESWIREQLGRRRADGQNVCVQLIVKGDYVDVRLSTPGCGSTGGGGREARGVELKIIEIWREAHLNSPEFSAGNVFAMLRRIHQVVG